MAAYEHLASSSLEQGYSKQVVDGRIVLLHAAVDGCRNLRNISLRSDRQSIALQEAKQGMVQWWLLPAALSLLQEVLPIVPIVPKPLCGCTCKEEHSHMLYKDIRGLLWPKQYAKAGYLYQDKVDLGFHSKSEKKILLTCRLSSQRQSLHLGGKH